MVPLEPAHECNCDEEELDLANPGLWFEQEEFSSLYENTEVLHEILDNLSPEHRAVLELKYYLEMTDQEIAETVNIPLGTVKSRLHCAKLNCRSLLKNLDFSFSCR
jgi:RNA polymerase sigma-70 factor (ECF subfamily)